MHDATIPFDTTKRYASILAADLVEGHKIEARINDPELTAWFAMHHENMARARDELANRHGVQANVIAPDGGVGKPSGVQPPVSSK